MDYNKYIAGGLSGIVEVLCTHPFDYLKTKKQEFAQRSINNNFYKLILKEPILNIYNGILPRILGVSPMRFIFWGVIDTTTVYLKDYKLNNFTKVIIIGSTSGFFQTLIDNPIELIKIQQISKQKINYKKILFKNYGYLSTLIRNSIFNSNIIFFCLKKEEDNNLYNFFISACGGVSGTFFTQPFDYIKTYQQRNKSKESILKLLSYNIKKNPKKLYTGFLHRSLLNFFAMGIGFVGYNNFYKLLKDN